jgi:hypothetical protein
LERPAQECKMSSGHATGCLGVAGKERNGQLLLCCFAERKGKARKFILSLFLKQCLVI